MGEGWSDFVALLMSVRPEDAGGRATRLVGAWTAGSYIAQSSVIASNAYYFRHPPLPLHDRHDEAAASAESHGHQRDDAVRSAEADRLRLGPEQRSTRWARSGAPCSGNATRRSCETSGRLTFTQARDRMRNYLVASLKMTPSTPTLVDARDALLMVAYANDPKDYQLFGAASPSVVWDSMRSCPTGTRTNSRVPRRLRPAGT